LTLVGADARRQGIEFADQATIDRCLWAGVCSHDAAIRE
jgi:hypothetical protein